MSKNLVLVVNSGSSSLKFRLFQNELSHGLLPAVSGLVERIGDAESVVNITTTGKGGDLQKVSELIDIPVRFSLHPIAHQVRLGTA